MAGDFDLLAAQRRVWQSSLKTLEKIVALAILDHWSTESPYPFPGIEQLGDWTSLERCSVMRALTGLLQRGALIAGHISGGRFVPEHRSGQSRAYDVRPLMSLAAAPRRQRSRRATGRAEQPVVESNPTGCREQPQPVVESNPKEPIEGTQEGTQDLKFALEPPNEPSKDPIAEVFEHWVVTLYSKHHKRKPKLTEDRRKPISGRLGEGYSVEELKLVIDAASKSDWHAGENDRGVVYIEPRTIMANAGKVDRWLATKTPTKPRKAVERQNNGVNIWKTSGQEVEEVEA